jgi:hypothetical protein
METAIRPRIVRAFIATGILLAACAGPATQSVASEEPPIAAPLIVADVPPPPEPIAPPERQPVPVAAPVCSAEATQGGAILCHDDATAAWLRRMRFDGRTEGHPIDAANIREIGWHCYMNPSTAAQGLMRMAGLPKYNPPLPNSDYPDLSTMEAFK